MRGVNRKDVAVALGGTQEVPGVGVMDEDSAAVCAEKTEGGRGARSRDGGVGFYGSGQGTGG